MGSGLDYDFLLQINEHLLKSDLDLFFDGERFQSGIEKNHTHEQNDALMQVVRSAHQNLLSNFLGILSMLISLSKKSSLSFKRLLQKNFFNEKSPCLGAFVYLREILIFQDRHILHRYFLHQVSGKSYICADHLYLHLDTLQG